MSQSKLARFLAPKRSRRRNESTPARAPGSLGEILASVVDAIGVPETESPISLEMWQEIVGPHIADRSRPERIDGAGTLFVQVADSVWAQELSLLSDAVVKRLSALGIRITGLRFAVGRVQAQRRGPTRYERRKVARAVEMPIELQHEMDRVQDTALRAAVTKAAASSLAETQAARRRVQRRSKSHGKAKP